MDRDRMDEGWQQLQARIAEMLAPYRTQGLPKIEYKAPSPTYQLEMPAKPRQRSPEAP